MNWSALVAFVYGTLILGGGVFAYRRVGSRPSLIGALVIGGLAILGSLLMSSGSPSGRGLALLGSVFAVLFFGWSLSRALLNSKAVGRPAGLLGLSIATAVLLLRGA